MHPLQLTTLAECVSRSETITLARVRRSGSLEMDMPTVAIVGQYQFVIRTREFDFEPPNVHVRVGNEDWHGYSWTTANIPMSRLRG